MTTEQAKRLADFLMGMEDAKQELLDAYVNAQHGHPNDRLLMDSGERWHAAFVGLADLLEEME